MINKLIVLAGNHREFDDWRSNQRKLLKDLKIEAIYLSQNSLGYLGIRDCFYIEIGSYYPNSVKNQEMYRYFSSHNIQRLIIPTNLPEIKL